MDERPDACPACRGTVLIRSGHACGRQRWRCKSCGRQLTRTESRGKLAALKLQAIELHCLGLSMNAVAKRVGVDHAPLGPGSCAAALPQARADREHGRRGDRRALALCQKKSQKLWIWKAFERGKGRLIDWECGDRSQATLDRLLERLERWGVRLFCTDDWAPGARPPAALRADRGDAALPAGRHYIGKSRPRTRSGDKTQRSE